MTLSATSFRDPLLRVLGDLTGFTPDVTVNSSETYGPIIALMGIPSIDAYGTNQASGTSMVVKWIQWANTDARKAGLTAAPLKTRGKWMLTLAGSTEARKLANSADDKAPAVGAPPTNIVAMATATTMSAATVPTKVTPTVNIMPATVGTPSSYHPDAYIRELAIDATGCFSRHSSHGAATCATCPLASDCRNKQIGVFYQIAIDLHAEDQQGKSTTKAVQDSKQKDAVTPTVRSKFADIDFSAVDVILCKFEATRCEACSKTIALNERCRWVEEIPGAGDGGLFHIGCSGGE